MARSNWNPGVIKARPKCRVCVRVVLTHEMVRLDGIAPAHRACADARRRTHTVGDQICPGGKAA